MKAKFLPAAIAFFAVFTLAGCGKTYEDSSGGDFYSEQISVSEQSSDTGLDGAEENSEVSVMYITVNSIKLEVELAENSSVEALVEILKNSDIVYTATDYGNFEKVGDIGYTLPTNDEDITTEAGDVILYLGRNICLYYGVNSWSFTRIGKINGYSEEELRNILNAGGGSMQITISLN
ncbi:MAG: hypothetical protein LUD27_04655 [Clostridia bacterium]|nr:hypothetical protein [Clostridia bacterium]